MPGSPAPPLAPAFFDVPASQSLCSAPADFFLRSHQNQACSYDWMGMSCTSQEALISRRRFFSAAQRGHHRFRCFDDALLPWPRGCVRLPTVGPHLTLPPAPPRPFCFSYPFSGALPTLRSPLVERRAFLVAQQLAPEGCSGRNVKIK